MSTGLAFAQRMQCACARCPTLSKVESPPAQFNQQLGHGAFKAVFKGYDEEEGIEVAWCQVNMERVGEDEKTQIHQEVDILKSLTHKVCTRSAHAWACSRPAAQQS